MFDPSNAVGSVKDTVLKNRCLLKVTFLVRFVFHRNCTFLDL